MPELPEVEVIRQGLTPHLTGRTITKISYDQKPLRLPVQLELMRRQIIGSRITSIDRRAKYLLIRFNNRSVLIIHLGMTGNLGIFPQDSIGKVHDHICWKLDNEMDLRFNDVRRFGSVQVVAPEASHNLESDFFKQTGVEPLEMQCTGKYLMDLAKGRKKPIKNFLMDSQIIAGIGNIYANECLFEAGIDPGKAVNQLSRTQWETLTGQIKSTLQHAISCGGSTISDFVDASGESGYFQMNFKVYGKAGDPCTNCLTPIEKKTMGGRATFFCPECQD